jgi:hypothetical protein
VELVLEENERKCMRMKGKDRVIPGLNCLLRLKDVWGSGVITPLFLIFVQIIGKYPWTLICYMNPLQAVREISLGKLNYFLPILHRARSNAVVEALC